MGRRGDSAEGCGSCVSARSEEEDEGLGRKKRRGECREKLGLKTMGFMGFLGRRR